MNNNYITNQEYEMDMLAFFRKLLLQWKAIIIVCIAMAFLVLGIKYLIDSKTYDAKLAEKAAAEEEAALPKEERIATILSSLSQDEVPTIQYILKTQDILNKQREYLNNSLLLNIDPTSQRNVSIKYYIQNENVSDITVLMDAYGTYMNKVKIIEALRDIISPDSPIEYIHELVGSWGGNITDSNVSSSVFTVNLILPDSVDKDDIISTIDAYIYDVHSTLNTKLGKHSITRFNIEDYHAYATGTIDRRTNITYTINNLNNTLNASVTGLNEEQKDALDAINAINNEQTSAEESVSIPSFRIIYAALGFVLGAILYTVLYLLIIIRKKYVFTASTAQSLSGVRPFGELYYLADSIGIEKLLSSKAAAKMLYKDKLNFDAQAEAVASSIDAVCSHYGMKDLALLICENSENLREKIDLLVTKYINSNHSLEMVTIDVSEMDEKTLSNFKNVIFAISCRSNADSIVKLSRLCRDYNVNVRGTIYIEEL